MLLMQELRHTKNHRGKWTREVSDWYVMKRIEALLKKGVLQVVIPNKIFYNTIVQLNEE